MFDFINFPLKEKISVFILLGFCFLNGLRKAIQLLFPRKKTQAKIGELTSQATFFSRLAGGILLGIWAMILTSILTATDETKYVVFTNICITRYVLAFAMLCNFINIKRKEYLMLFVFNTFLGSILFYSFVLPRII